MPKGLNFNPYDEIIDQPRRNKTLEGFNFLEISFSQDSAAAIARSIILNFEIPEGEDSDIESARHHKGAGAKAHK